MVEENVLEGNTRPETTTEGERGDSEDIQQEPARLAIARLEPTREMNKLEQAYAEDLGLLLSTGMIRRWYFESMKFRLADNTWYTPDFIVINNEGHLEAHEVKGFLRDDAAVKFKVAAALYAWLKWIMIKRRPKKDGGGWITIYEK